MAALAYCGGKKKNVGFPGHSVEKKDVFPHPYRGSKPKGPPFEGPETSVQKPRGAGGAPSHRHKEGRWMEERGAFAPLTSVITHFHTASIDDGLNF